MKLIPSFFKVLFKLMPISLVTMLMTPTRTVSKIPIIAFNTVGLTFPMVLFEVPLNDKSALLIFILSVSFTILIVAFKFTSLVLRIKTSWNTSEPDSF